MNPPLGSLGRFTAALLVAALAVLALPACQSERVDPFDAPEPQLETEDIGASPTDGLTAEADERARRRDVSSESALVGRLPSTFPADLPVYQPASVIDFSEEGVTPAFVELRSTHAESRVRSFYQSRMSAAQWQAAGATRWQKNGRSVEIQIRSDGPASSVIRIVY